MGIRFEGVTHRYEGGGAARAGVFGVDLEVARGEFVALIGPSGSGKSTLLKLLAGFLAPQEGRVLVGGRDVTREPVHRRDLGIVFQHYALFAHMSAAANVAYPLKVRGVPPAERRARALKALDEVGLSAQAERLPAGMSGGQQQRVALARALVFQPRALLLDEPLSALDAALRGAMRDAIVRAQRAAGVPALHVTHDQEEALSMADRVAVLREGRLLQVAAPAELYDRPVDAVVAAFVGQANLWDGAVEADGAVRLALGRLACPTGALPPGAPVTVLVRPERVIALTAADPGEGLPNRFAGAVTRDRFLGPARRYDLAVRGGAVVGETRERGDLVAFAVPPEAVRLLPPREAAPARPTGTEP